MTTSVDVLNKLRRIRYLSPAINTPLSAEDEKELFDLEASIEDLDPVKFLLDYIEDLSGSTPRFDVTADPNKFVVELVASRASGKPKAFISPANGATYAIKLARRFRKDELDKYRNDPLFYRVYSEVDVSEHSAGRVVTVVMPREP